MRPICYKGLCIGEGKYYRDKKFQDVEECDFERKFVVDDSEADQFKTAESLAYYFYKSAKEEDERLNYIKKFTIGLTQASTDFNDYSFYGSCIATQTSKQHYQETVAGKHDIIQCFSLKNEIMYVNAPVQLDELSWRNTNYGRNNMLCETKTSIKFKNMTSQDIDNIMVLVSYRDMYGNFMGAKREVITNDYYEPRQDMNLVTEYRVYNDAIVVSCEIITVKIGDVTYDYNQFDRIKLKRNTKRISDVFDYKQIKFLYKEAGFMEFKDNFMNSKRIPSISGEYVSDLYGDIDYVKNRQNIVKLYTYLQNDFEREYKKYVERDFVDTISAGVKKDIHILKTDIDKSYKLIWKWIGIFMLLAFIYMLLTGKTIYIG